MSDVLYVCTVVNTANLVCALRTHVCTSVQLTETKTLDLTPHFGYECTDSVLNPLKTEINLKYI